MASPIFNEPFIAAALGLVPSEQSLYKFGRRNNVGNALFEDIAPEATYAGFIPIADSDTLSIASSSDLDDFASTGCQVLRVIGLDENLAVQVKDYNMDGQTPVVTTGDLWSRVFRMRSRQAANRRIPNVGAIIVSSTASGTPIMAVMPAGTGSTLTTNFTMPAGMTGGIKVVSSGMGNNKVGDIRLIMSQIVDDENRPFNVELNLPVTAGPAEVGAAFFVPEKTDVIAEAKALTGTVDAFLTYLVYIMTNNNLVDPIQSNRQLDIFETAN